MDKKSLRGGPRASTFAAASQKHSPYLTKSVTEVAGSSTPASASQKRAYSPLPRSRTAATRSLSSDSRKTSYFLPEIVFESAGPSTSASQKQTSPYLTKSDTGVAGSSFPASASHKKASSYLPRSVTEDPGPSSSASQKTTSPYVPRNVAEYAGSYSASTSHKKKSSSLGRSVTGAPASSCLAPASQNKTSSYLPRSVTEAPGASSSASRKKTLPSVPRYVAEYAGPFPASTSHKKTRSSLPRSGTGAPASSSFAPASQKKTSSYLPKSVTGAARSSSASEKITSFELPRNITETAGPSSSAPALQNKLLSSWLNVTETAGPSCSASTLQNKTWSSRLNSRVTEYAGSSCSASTSQKKTWSSQLNSVTEYAGPSSSASASQIKTSSSLARIVAGAARPSLSASASLIKTSFILPNNVTEAAGSSSSASQKKATSFLSRNVTESVGPSSSASTTQIKTSSSRVKQMIGLIADDEKLGTSKEESIPKMSMVKALEKSPVGLGKDGFHEPNEAVKTSSSFQAVDIALFCSNACSIAEAEKFMKDQTLESYTESEIPVDKFIGRKREKGLPLHNFIGYRLNGAKMANFAVHEIIRPNPKNVCKLELHIENMCMNLIAFKVKGAVGGKYVSGNKIGVIDIDGTQVVEIAKVNDDDFDGDKLGKSHLRKYITYDLMVQVVPLKTGFLEKSDVFRFWQGRDGISGSAAQCYIVKMTVPVNGIREIDKPMMTFERDPSVPPEIYESIQNLRKICYDDRLNTKKYVQVQNCFLETCIGYFSLGILVIMMILFIFIERSASA